MEDAELLISIPKSISTESIHPDPRSHSPSESVTSKKLDGISIAGLKEVVEAMGGRLKLEKSVKCHVYYFMPYVVLSIYTIWIVLLIIFAMKGIFFPLFFNIFHGRSRYSSVFNLRATAAPP